LIVLDESRVLVSIASMHPASQVDKIRTLRIRIVTFGLVVGPQDRRCIALREEEHAEARQAGISATWNARMCQQLVAPHNQ
jgi:hypothetical protein